MKPAPASKSKLKLQTIYFWWLLPALILAPLWVGLGRGLFGVGGWGFVITLFIFAPIIFAIQLIMLLLNFSAERLNQPKMVSRASLYAMSAYYAAVFLWGLAIVDAGDVAGSSASLLTKLFGEPFLGLSHLLSVVGGFGTFVFGAWAIVTSLLQILVSKRRRANQSAIIEA